VEWVAPYFDWVITNKKSNKFSRRGVSTVEFAICLPVFLLMVCGFIDFCRYYFLVQSLSHAAREGLRAGVIFNPLDPANVGVERATVIRNTINNDAIIPGGLAPTPTSTTGARLTINPANGGAALERVTITLEADFRFITPLVSVFSPANGKFPVRVTSTFRNEP
jgi:Flp pilus assembly protein TadG